MRVHQKMQLQPHICQHLELFCREWDHNWKACLSTSGLPLHTCIDGMIVLPFLFDLQTGSKAQMYKYLEGRENTA